MKKILPQEVVGLKFNKLIIVSFIEHRGIARSRAAYYECKCECGNSKVIRITDITTGRIKSCGCIQKSIASKLGKLSRLPLGKSPFNNLFNSYLRGANRRNIEFNLSEHEFLELVKENCYYCNEIPLFITKNRYYPDDLILHNGVDRKNNEQGYFIKNCVSCCSTCNYMKGDLGFEEFLNHIKKIAKTNP